MTSGDMVWTAVAIAQTTSMKPMAFVRQATVLDAENRILKLESGQVIAISSWSSETIHDSESEAWTACAGRLSAKAAEIDAEARNCAANAAKAAAAAAVGEAVPS